MSLRTPPPDGLDELLRAADPVERTRTDDGAVGALLSALPAAAERARRGSRRRLGIGAILGAATLLIAVPASAAVFYLAQTGQFGLPGFTENDETEYIEVTADDFVEYTETIFPQYLPLPAGIGSDDLRETVATRMHDDAVELAQAEGAPSVVRQVTGIQRQFESAAYCLWIEDFFDASAESDDDRASTAVDRLREAADWPAMVATDGGGVTDGMRELAALAAEGDIAAVRAQLGIDCDGAVTIGELAR